MQISTIPYRTGAIDYPPSEDLSDFLMHPIRPVSSEKTDIDSLCILLQSVQEDIRSLRSVEYQIRNAFKALTIGTTTKTRRVIGHFFEAKVVMPDDHWEQSVMKELAATYPHLADKYLRIERYAPRMREVKKLENSVGHPEIETFRDTLLGCRSPGTSPPSVSVTEIEADV